MNVGTVWSKFQDMGLRNKLAIVVGVLALPVFALLVLQYTDRSRDILLAEDQSSGLAYLKEGPVPVLQQIQRHRLLEAAVRSGETSLAGQLQQSTAALDEAVTRYARFEKDHGGYKTADFVAKLESQWGALRDSREATTADGVISAHNRMVDESIFPILFQAGNSSRLYLDSNLTTFDTIVGTSQDLMNQNEAVSRAAAYGALVASRLGNGQAVGALLRGERGELTSQLKAAETTADSTSRWLEGALSRDTRYESALRQPLLASTGATSIFLAKAANLADGPTSAFDTAAVVTAATKATDANYALFNAGFNLVGSDLDQRQSDKTAGLALTMGLSAAAFAVAILLAWLVSQSITRPIAHLVAVADKMSLGDLDSEIDVRGNNEIGKLADSLRRMQTSLKGAIERLRTRRAA